MEEFNDITDLGLILSNVIITLWLSKEALIFLRMYTEVFRDKISCLL